MTRMCFYLLLVGFMALPALGVPLPKPTKQDRTAAELLRLEGTWVPVFCQRDGVESTAEQVENMRALTFKGVEITNDGVLLGKISDIDPTASPKTIEYRSETASEERKIQKGIYTLDGDIFIECLALGGKDRPKEFVSKEGSGFTLLKFKRMKQ